MLFNFAQKEVTISIKDELRENEQEESKTKYVFRGGIAIKDINTAASYTSINWKYCGCRLSEDNVYPGLA